MLGQCGGRGMSHVSPTGCSSGPLGLGIHPLAGPGWLGSRSSRVAGNPFEQGCEQREPGGESYRAAYLGGSLPDLC